MAFKMKGAPYPMHGDTDPFAPTGKEKRQLRRQFKRDYRKFQRDERKDDREVRRFERKYGAGQAGIDEYRSRQRNKGKGLKNLGASIKRGLNRLTGKTVGKGGQSGSGFKPDCKKGNCGAYS